MKKQLLTVLAIAAGAFACAAPVSWDITSGSATTGNKGIAYDYAPGVPNGTSYSLVITTTLTTNGETTNLNLNGVNLFAIGSSDNFPSGWGGGDDHREKVISIRTNYASGSTDSYTFSIGTGNYDVLLTSDTAYQVGDTVTIGLAYDAATGQFTFTVEKADGTDAYTGYVAAPEGFDTSLESIFVHNDNADISGTITYDDGTPVPEPTALAVLALGVAGLALRRKVA